ncbi:MAG: AAA family ATPase, partial [Anaerolineae bacterium]|nr:AAA family ATPase [Anaerolineae bacterium]
MECSRCGRENPDQARFCLHCGARLAAACRQCGALVSPLARFCSECGAGVDQAPSAASIEPALRRLIPREYAERLLATRGQPSPERRTVTILFSDVKGSTALAEDLDPEDVLEIMSGAFDLLIEPVYRYEGTLARLMGDAVLAFFGAPLAHEDDPERACRAALEILAGARAYAARLEAERGIHGFDVRVGIHTGLVVVGEVGSDLRVEYTAMGDAVNLAARLEQAAEPGTVLISQATHNLVASLFETEALPPIAVKGKAEPVAVYRVLAAKGIGAKPRGIAGLGSPLVGRQAEFGALKEALSHLQAGRGGVVTIVGEAGIGKSRLVAELRGATHFQSALHLAWLEGRCLSYGSSLAYLLWLDILRGLLGVTLDDGPDAVRDVLERRILDLCAGQFEDLYPYLARLMSLSLEKEAEDRLEELSGRELRDRTFQAVGTLLASAARQRPLVVVCEDLHWADATSLELLEHLLPLSGELPLLFLCVFRPVRNHPCWGLRERVSAEGSFRHTDLRLASLTAEESKSLVSNLLWVDELPPGLKERILDRAEGNPFYLEEILRSLIDQGALIQDPRSGHWQAAIEVERILIPDTLEGVLVARIDRLEEETRRLLQLASVIGRIFLYRILAEIARAESAAYEQLRLDQRLETLQREDLIRERARIPELEYIFKHDLTREAAYNGLLKRRRRAYHQQVAEALERLFPERVEELLGLLAYHWEQAGVAEKAVDCLQRAGDQARLAYALDEAVGYYQRALAFLRQGEDHRATARMLMKLGLAYHNAFRYEEARQANAEGFRLWQQAAERAPVHLPPAPHALRLAPYDPVSLDPALGGDWQLFSGLVELTPEADVVPDVARGWDVLDDGCTYVFHLRDDVRWSDGMPVTA